MKNQRILLAVCFLLIGCEGANSHSEKPGGVKDTVSEEPREENLKPHSSSTTEDGQSVIRVGDLLPTAIEVLARHQMSASRIPEDVDDPHHSRYSVSRSRNPDDVLILVVSWKPAASGTIEEIYWESDVEKQNVPKSVRPEPTRESVQSIQVSELPTGHAK